MHHGLTEENNLSCLPRGLQTFGGTPFDVRGVVLLSRYAGARAPAEVTGIPVQQRVRRLSFLCASRATAPEDTVIGKFQTGSKAGPLQKPWETLDQTFCGVARCSSSRDETFCAIARCSSSLSEHLRTAEHRW